MKLQPRNIIYMLIIVLFIITGIWYFSKIYEGYDNDNKNSCDNPEEEVEYDNTNNVSYDNMTADEIKKQSNKDMEAEKERLARPPKTRCNIISKSFKITLKNSDEDENGINYTLPEIKVIRKNPALANIKIDYTKVLKEKDILDDSGKRIYMMDVDPNSEGIIKPTYNISSLSINYPDKELSIAEFNEYVTNSSLYNVYNKKQTKVLKLVHRVVTLYLN